MILRRLGAAAVAVCVLAGCSSAPSPPKSSAPNTSAPRSSTAPTTAPTSSTRPASTSSSAPTTARTRSSDDASGPRVVLPSSTSSSVTRPRSGAPVIVVDPGHSVTVTATDPNTGLNVSDYENEPEMRDVYSVAERVRDGLTAAGYRVILTKPSLDTPTSLARRAEIANDAGAALALSIHDEAGSGGIGFRSGNNIVYYQSDGTYRATPSGKRVYFSRSSVAALSKRYGEIFQRKRAAAQGTSVRLQGDVGYNLGSRGLPAGNIWIVQLLSHVPWIYNEAGGNSAGRSGLNGTDKTAYANGLIAAVKACVPLRG